ncbi:MAG: efflux RND transporter periplasmic adaptor subunit [bacterium]
MHLYKKLSIILGLIIIIVIAGCGKTNSAKSDKSQKQQAVPVVVATVAQKDIPLQFRTIGTVEEYSIVSVLSQVGGTISSVNFKPGQQVNKGALLFTIDPRPFQTTLQQMEANVAKDSAQLLQAYATLSKDSAQLNYAKQQVDRYADLIKAGVVTQEAYDQIILNQKTIAATIQADLATINAIEQTIQADRAVYANAKLQLDYCYIHAPMAGITGDYLVDQGNVVKSSDKALVTISQLDPIYISFSIPQNDLAELKKYMTGKTLKVEAIIKNDTEHTVTGDLSFLNSAIDRTTGTLKLKAIFHNQSYKLWPGQFVNVILTLQVEPNRIVVPEETIQTGQQGQFAYVVKPDKTVESRPVVTGREYNHDIIVEKGLAPGEIVVTDGQIRLTPGAKVDIKKTGLSEKSEVQSPNQ